MRSSRSDRLVFPKRILLYEDPSSRTVDLGELGSFLEGVTHAAVQTRPDFFSHHPVPELEALATRLARTKVRSLEGVGEEVEPLLGEVTFEVAQLRDPRKGRPGILYDGFALQEVLRTLLPPEERSLRTLHLVFTSRLLGTLDAADRRYHARVILCGYPSVISTSGLVEGPAKPREFYLTKRGYSVLGMAPPTEALKAGLEGRFLDYDDERTTEVLKGYTLQAYFYHVTGDPFCTNPECRLFNAHWQEEMIHAQLASGTLCEEHQQTLETFA